jgi:hypothetical protein
MRNTCLAGFMALAASTGALAQDIKGSRDHPLVPRYEDSQIVRYATEDFTDYRLFTQPRNTMAAPAKTSTQRSRSKASSPASPIADRPTAPRLKSSAITSRR